MNDLTGQLISFLISLPCILIALSVHEAAHGWMAYKLGDPTARNFGRLTLNPLKHIDPIGAICMVLFKFGWARPVPVNSRYFKKPRRDMALTAAAGPIANFIAALLAMLLLSIYVAVCNAFPPQSQFAFNLQFVGGVLLSSFHSYNLYLGLFNLLPVPPLDGSRIFLVFLPAKWYFGVMKYERYIQFALLLLLWTGVLSLPLGSLAALISRGMQWLVSLLPFI